MAEIRLAEYCQRLRHDLDNATYQEKREILEMLAIRAVATPEELEEGNILGCCLLHQEVLADPLRHEPFSV